MNETLSSGMNAMGKTIPFFRKEKAYQLAKSLGYNTETSYSVVNSISDSLERDHPFEAQQNALKLLHNDLTMVYMMFAYLLTGDRNEIQTTCG